MKYRYKDSNNDLKNRGLNSLIEPVEAFQFGREKMPDWFIQEVVDKKYLISGSKAYVIKQKNNGENDTFALDGYYIIRFSSKDMCAVPPETFENLYEKVEEDI